MSLNNKVEKLEEKMRPGAYCPHLPPIVRHFKSDGTEDLARHDSHKDAPSAGTVCPCGSERLMINVRQVEGWRP